MIGKRGSRVTHRAPFPILAARTADTEQETARDSPSRSAGYTPAQAQSGLTKKQRTTIIRTVQYAVIVIIIVVIALIGNWSVFREDFLNWHQMGQILPRMIKEGLKNTLVYTVTSFIYGLVLGLIIALMRLSQVRLYRWIGTVYVEIFRGLPALLVLYLLNFGLPDLFGNNALLGNFYVLVTLGLGTVASAYMAETIRAGIQAVPKGQMEAARTLGMPPGRAMRSDHPAAGVPHHHPAADQ